MCTGRKALCTPRAEHSEHTQRTLREHMSESPYVPDVLSIAIFGVMLAFRILRLTDPSVMNGIAESVHRVHQMSLSCGRMSKESFH